MAAMLFKPSTQGIAAVAAPAQALRYAPPAFAQEPGMRNTDQPPAC
jgi:hypothetical protein